MVRIISLVIALAIIIGTGVVHGNYAGRWGAADALILAAKKIDNIPMDFGDWKGRDRKIDPEDTKRAQAERIFAREYVNEKTRMAMSVLIVCGRPGTVSVHTPDICFQGQGRIMMSAVPETVTVDLGDESGKPLLEEFQTADFHRPDAANREQQRVYWTWSTDGTWVAPSNPRVEFIWNNTLYKLYIVRSVSPLEELKEGELDPSLQFAEQLIPVLNKALFDLPSGETKAEPVAAK